MQNTKLSSDEALRLLKEGNARYIVGKSTGWERTRHNSSFFS
jgi:hypothetical protein